MRCYDNLLLDTGKDGGPDSKVFGYWLVRIKKLFSVALLRFDKGSREAYHTHAFNSVSWVLKGKLEECMLTGEDTVYTPSWRPIFTKRDTFHKVYGCAPRTWVLTFRGPWCDKWLECTTERGLIVLTHNRIEVTGG